MTQSVAATLTLYSVALLSSWSAVGCSAVGNSAVGNNNSSSSTPTSSGPGTASGTAPGGSAGASTPLPQSASQLTTSSAAPSVDPVAMGSQSPTSSSPATASPPDVSGSVAPSSTAIPVPSSSITSNPDAGSPRTDASTEREFYPCDAANPADYNVVATKNGTAWSVNKGAQNIYTGDDFQQALTSAYGGLSEGRTSKESILVLGDGELSASIQLAIPSYTILNVCGTVNVTGTASGSDRSPFYARNAQHIDIPNLKLTGSPQYGVFLRQTNDIHLGQIELRLTRDAGIGIRVDAGPNAGSSSDFNRNLTVDYVYGTGMGSHILETYGIDQITIGAIEGEDVGECGLLLNRSIHATVGSVTCTDCGTGTGYAAFRVANSVGKVGNEFPAGNIHVGKVTARGGGRGIFSVSGCGGLIIDTIDIADTGNTSILMQNTYNTVIAAESGVVSGGLVQLTNDTDNTNAGTYPPSQDVRLQNLTLTNGASVRQDWCAEFGSNGCSASNITGGTVSMCD